MLTKGAIGNLVNRYRAVLTKCNLINTFGSLAVASMLVLGGAGVASAANPDITAGRVVVNTGESLTLSAGTYDNIVNTTNNYGGAIENWGTVSINKDATQNDPRTTFSNNTLAVSASYVHGGTIANRGTNAKLYINNTDFKNNSAYYL